MRVSGYVYTTLLLGGDGDMWAILRLTGLRGVATFDVLMWSTPNLTMSCPKAPTLPKTPAPVESEF